MPKREDIKSILILGSGPIVIGQACEFDYSGTQGCKALRQEGYRVILVNSNPATIMTDPETGDATYIEPLDVPTVAKIIEKERPDCLLPTLGGQTALNLAIDLCKAGVLEKYGVELIGAKREAIEKAEDREKFKLAMQKIGLEVPKSFYARNLTEALAMAREVGFPTIIRPSFTLGGTGAGIAYNREELEHWLKWALDMSPTHEVLIEESILGWKEYELEVMRDTADNVVIICSIENFDAMGIHTGDSITVAPAQTLTDKEYQRLRDASIAVIREIGVDTGGSNIQFGINPKDGRVVVIEMNPRVSRSSALASKATGFPIAKIAAKLAVGYTLDELPNDITGLTPASFEPTIDYVVVKIPRWNFDKFPGSVPRLGMQMKSVGEAMSIGRSFKEALQKALRSLEIGRFGFGADGKDKYQIEKFLQGETTKIYRQIESMRQIIEKELRFPGTERIFYLRYALQLGMSVNEVYEISGVDPWFLENLLELIEAETNLNIDTYDGMLHAKQLGYSDRQLASMFEKTEIEIRDQRKALGVLPVYKIVDTCAAEFAAETPYLYSTYERLWIKPDGEGRDSEVRPDNGKKKVMILGGGPNRIGQGIEFDYCCCHAVFALKEMGFETIMVNSNPETVSTDYDTSDRLYFEPLTFEDVLNIYEAEQPIGVILQFGGQTPLNLALSLQEAGVPVLGTDPKNIHRAEDRKAFAKMLDKLGIPYPPAGTALNLDEARRTVEQIGYPVLVRPSYVLGGRAMVIVHHEDELERCFSQAVEASPDHPVLIDKFLEDAIEIDVDAVSDKTDVYIGGIMEHIEYAGVHSGDSACVLPPHTLPPEIIETVRDYTRKLALENEVVGLMNVQYAVSFPKGREGKSIVYVLEVNPRASRTVPFVSKATGVPLAKVAARVMVGESLKKQGVIGRRYVPHLAVKEAVLPFVKFPGVDIILGPEMKSTGEVMGLGKEFGTAFAKAEAGAWCPLPDPKTMANRKKIFISVNERDKEEAVEIARGLRELGFEILSTPGTHRYLQERGVEAQSIHKINEGRPNALDSFVNEEVCLVINTPLKPASHQDELALRRAALERGITYMTTMAASRAALEAMRALRDNPVSVKSLQEYQAETRFE